MTTRERAQEIYRLVLEGDAKAVSSEQIVAAVELEIAAAVIEDRRRCGRTMGMREVRR